MIYRDLYRNYPTTRETRVLQYDTMKNWQKFIKRSFDIILSITGLLLFSWLFVIIYIAIKIQNDGPVFFGQERIGKNGKPFTIYKFRTMPEDAEKFGPQLETKDDYRITKLGKILREHHFDELPQLFNVLIGDMSVVGPRPPLPDEVEQYSKSDRQRLLVTPGLTCFWQASTDRNDISFARWMELDRKYIAERSVGVDLKLILKTVYVIFRHHDGR